ncbi:unnamed protein product [Aphanomyces euteiches]|uniref:BZIP domain-containing protein n=1 Tax=Aphanomyces euteiches TaxID=100861 RepID=A0A6G0XA91_9STRA|nr:hypothetical protein Ae201684_006833 [Aphanomyces euteiches]KAH9086794.1 hypothetical protein Ae201684P_000213 [Aphanomyces euteiches]KAH9140301.1 hypothetical protein AeRB84_015438 [Aphanomyces euteiches]
MSLEYLLDVAIQIDQPNFPQEYMDKPDGTPGSSPVTDSPDSLRHTNDGTIAPLLLSDDEAFGVKVECNQETSMLKPVYKFSTSLYRKAEAARRRRVAIERRNARRKIVPKQVEVEETQVVCIDRNKTKNRISAASYRENRDKRVLFIQNEIQQLQAEFPHLESQPWTPIKKPKSAIREGETKDEYRKRTNRESAADSRFQQQQKLQYLTRELARLRALTQQQPRANEE